MDLLKGEKIVNFLTGVVYKEKQVFPHCVHLTVRKIYKVVNPAKVDFGGGEYREADIQAIPPEKSSAEDKYGWWNLSQGIYIVQYNELLSLPSGYLAIVQPSKRILLNGCSHPVALFTDPASPYKTLLHVGLPGIEIKENARISTLLLLKL